MRERSVSQSSSSELSATLPPPSLARLLSRTRGLAASPPSPLHLSPPQGLDEPLIGLPPPQPLVDLSTSSPPSPPPQTGEGPSLISPSMSAPLGSQSLIRQPSRQLSAESIAELIAQPVAHPVAQPSAESSTQHREEPSIQGEMSRHLLSRSASPYPGVRSKERRVPSQSEYDIPERFEHSPSQHSLYMEPLKSVKIQSSDPIHLWAAAQPVHLTLFNLYNKTQKVVLLNKLKQGGVMVTLPHRHIQSQLLGVQSRGVIC